MSALVLKDDAVFEDSELLKVITEVTQRQIVGQATDEDLAILWVRQVDGATLVARLGRLWSRLYERVETLAG